MHKITVVGLGPGSAGQLSVETMELLKNGECVILRTAVHPSVSRLTEEKVNFTACDNFYEEGASFEDVYGNIVNFVLEKAQTQDVVYAVPGSPLVAERTRRMLFMPFRAARLWRNARLCFCGNGQLRKILH